MWGVLAKDSHELQNKCMNILKLALPIDMKGDCCESLASMDL